jgi:acetylornithine/N-succinyldiaminopimelate aminotransferase
MNLKTLFLQHLAQTSPSPISLEITHAEGSVLTDSNGKTYFDLISGISVSSLGHGNKKVIQAIQSQAEKYLHLMVYGEFILSPQVKLAAKLAEFLPFKENSSIFFTNSGSEAIEAAIKLAKRASGRSEFIALKNSYHGSTHAALSLSADPYFSDFYRPLLPNFKQINSNNWEDLEKLTNKTAAVIIETVMGEAGYLCHDPEWITALQKKCNENGILLILDEIQCGMGRTGTLFAFENYHLKPDIIVLAKAFGGGMPLGAIAAHKNLMQYFASKPILGNITTFGGHPVSCAAALASLEFITENKLQLNAIEMENVIKKNITHPFFKSITGKGLMLGIETPSTELNFKFIDKCIQKGILTDWFLYASNKIRIAPPLIITQKEVEYCMHIFNDIADELQPSI